MSTSTQTHSEPVKQRQTKSAKRGSRKEQPAKAECMISGLLFFLTVGTIIGFYIQQLLPKL
ncbi:hypothetical protein MD588_02295 [Photobacterium sp. SDRW27]|uniref:hypothetical protein n=1 Tax=Photobacterium obscurum TaxID=2829490 RepID=UPI002243CB37|nr:hypothetical protein [Photobacterium obscurum]MCW8327634.1 hypothetical protein [Photobacterium obscurum]